MSRSYAKPTRAVLPLKAFVVVSAQPTESITADQKSRGFFPTVLMSADSVADIQAIYGADFPNAKDRYIIVPATEVPELALRTINASEARYICNAIQVQTAHIEADGMLVSRDDKTQEYVATFRNRKPIPNLPATLTVPHIGTIIVRFEPISQLPEMLGM